uniref:Dead box ATP-dependent RNA helicase n=1 Tax=Rhizophora mucronata TaxID=61149 RepID=A0A2P2K5H2_RHIMU
MPIKDNLSNSISLRNFSEVNSACHLILVETYPSIAPESPFCSLPTKAFQCSEGMPICYAIMQTCLLTSNVLLEPGSFFHR